MSGAGHLLPVKRVGPFCWGSFADNGVSPGGSF